MIKGIYHSAAGMVPRYHRLVNVSNNLANANTTGFKADRRYFTTLINNELVQPGIEGTPDRIEELDTGLQTQFNQGSLRKTEVFTDLAINGDGFFVVQNPDTGDEYYTRNGWFRITSDGDLLTQTGLQVMDEAGTPIVIEGNSFQMTDTGDIYSNGELKTKIQVVDFENRHILVKKGDGLFANPTDIDPFVQEGQQLLQGFLETSNVNVIEEMVIMISLNRNYESSQKALHAQDETLKQAVNQVCKF